MSHRELYCDVCEGVAPFETPPCVDDHGTDCPELICVDCGFAVLIAPFAAPVTRLAERRRPQPTRRRAA
ncbi:hypothetical protein [Micromonospora tarensis]|uniref:Uncharacterized protein n=1 Tax=Micromonospora tarensis TaxID=2806100 RepID=A0ABS1YEP5_9ACTN|nr:hypothetical protein [Micromonospora tarensis]MBM0275832.1 hypothetical protein [Micromonospora tarensis]